MRDELRGCDVGGLRLTCMLLEGGRSDDALRSLLEEYRQDLLAMHRTQTRVVSIVYFGEGCRYTAQQRRIQANWNRDLESLMRAIALGCAFVTASGVLRGMITAVFWLTPPAVPHAVCKTFDEALFWVFNVCEQNGFPITEACRRDARAQLSAARPVVAS